MTETKSRDYAWNKSWIEFKAPNSTGVYWLRDKDGKVIFIGKGKIRECLLGHWNRENSTDARIWNYDPATFRFESTERPTEREAELIQELRPICNPVAHSGFPKFW
jgi:excinuclease UvrABC nuclease subunit